MYDIQITFSDGTRRLLPFGMPRNWCEAIIAEDVLPQYGRGSKVEIIPRA